MLSSSMYPKHSTAQHSTTQHAAISTHKQPITYVPIRARRRNQTELASASMFSSIYKNKRRHRNVVGLHKIQPLTKQPSWCDARDLPLFPISIRYNTGPSFIFVLYKHAASGLFAWSTKLLAFASRPFAPERTPHSFLCSFSWASVAGDGRKPPAERSALYPLYSQLRPTGINTVRSLRYAYVRTSLSPNMNNFSSSLNTSIFATEAMMYGYREPQNRTYTHVAPCRSALFRTPILGHLVRTPSSIDLG